MAILDGFPAASGTVDSTELRKALAGLILRDTSGNARAGVFPRHVNALVTAKPIMAVDVAAFEGVSVRGGGPIFMANDGTASVPIDAAPGSNSRIDVVYFKQNEQAAPYSDANELPVLGVAKGTAAPAPVKPAIPAGGVELATIRIPAGVSATNAGGVILTQTFQYTAVSGAPLWVRNSTERGALPTFAVGTELLQLDTSERLEWSGLAWVLIGSPPGVKLLRTSGDTYSVPNNVSTQIANARLTQQYAVGVTVTTGADLRVTIQRAGRYRVSAALTFYNNASGARILRVNKNSTTATTDQIAYASGPGAGSALTTISVATDVVLAANDAIRLHAFQNSGGTLELMSSADTIQGTFLDLTFIGAT